MKKQPPKFNFEEFQAKLIEEIKPGKDLLGKGGILTPFLKQCLEASLEGEMDSHMANCLEEPAPTNHRNGKMTKQMRSPSGSFELEVPRDRDSSFEPQIVKKRQTVLNASLDNKILALYGLGMSYQDIANHLEEMYDFGVSPTTISAVTDKLLPLITEWRSHPLEAIYPIIFLDGIYFKVCENGKFVTLIMVMKKQLMKWDVYT